MKTFLRTVAQNTKLLYLLGTFLGVGLPFILLPIWFPEVQLLTEPFEISTTSMASSDFADRSLVKHDFSGQDLRGVSFRGADLREANFKKANLSGADFSGANLEGATFTGANLVGVNGLLRR